jgi:hypothetical protein
MYISIYLCKPLLNSFFWTGDILIIAASFSTMAFAYVIVSSLITGYMGKETAEG